MYQYISAIAKALTGDGKWAIIDISNIPLNVLFTEYSRIIVTLSNPFLPSNIAVDLITIRPVTEGLAITIIDFLLQNGNQTLIALPNIPTLNPKYAKYADAFHAEYKIDLIGPKTSVSTQMLVSDKTWLYLTKPSIDYSLFYKSCLVNVNGFFHLTDFDTSGIYVVDGAKSQYKSRQNQIGIYSFSELGSLSFIPITETMVHKQNINSFYKDEVYVDLGVDVSTKTVMMVLGGYLHVLDNKTFTRTSASAFRIDIANFPLLERYYESVPYLDLSSLQLSSDIRNSKQVAISEIFSDAAILAYFTLSQSFFVVLDNPDIFINRIPVRKTPLPNMFIGYQKPEYPLVVGMEKITNYWYTPEDGQYSITCCDTLRRNFLFDTIDPTKVNSVSDACIPNRQLEHSNAYMLQIGTVII